MGSASLTGGLSVGTPTGKPNGSGATHASDAYSCKTLVSETPAHSFLSRL